MFIKYKIDNGSNADAIADTFDNAMSALAPPPPPKKIISINLIIKYEPGLPGPNKQTNIYFFHFKIYFPWYYSKDLKDTKSDK